MKKKFFKVGGFLSTITCVEGFHIPIVAPGNNENSFVNRKGWHSINVEGVSDADNVFVDIIAKWPGSTHDSYIQNLQFAHILGGKPSQYIRWLDIR